MVLPHTKRLIGFFLLHEYRIYNNTNNNNNNINNLVLILIIPKVRSDLVSIRPSSIHLHHRTLTGVCGISTTRVYV